MKSKEKVDGWPRVLIRITLCVIAFSTVTAVDAEVTATLAPAEVSVGESAELTVTVGGSRSNAPSLPAVDGLDFQNVGQSTQIQVINGAMTADSTHTYVVTPQHAGTFTIPAIEAGGAKSNPITLRVLAGSGAVVSAQRGLQSSPSSSLPPPKVNAAPSSVSPPRTRSSGSCGSWCRKSTSTSAKWYQ